MDTPRSHDDHVGVSPNWYCSGAGREDELKLELSSFQARVARLEGQLKEKDAELDEAREALSHERRLEIESLHNMKTGSEKIIEQKSHQVQQLHGAVQKLNEALRKKDQQLHTIVSQNLRSDGAYTEASADLTESRLSLKHAEADLTKERVTLQRLEVQMTSVTSQNQRLEELVQQYRLELQRKDAALNATLAKEDGQDRLRHRSALEAAESLGEASTHLARLEHELSGQESNLLSSISGPVRCYPSVTQPGKRVKITVQSHSAEPPKMTSASNAHDVADMRAVPCDDGEYAHRFESSFVAGQRAGVALVSFCLSTPNGLPIVAQAVALVEDAGRTSDLSGTTFATRHPRCHLACDMEVLITPRNAMGELVQVSLASEPLPHASPQRTSSASDAAFEPTVQVSGADIVSHARRLTDHTYRIVVRPSAAAMTISFTDNTGILASTTIGVDSPTPDHTRTVVEAPDSVTVGDRGTLQVKLFDSLGFPCPAGVAPSQLLSVSAGAGPASDATDVSDDIVELGYGVYGIHFVPLAIGTSVLNVAVGKAQERVFTARVHVAGAGGAASLDRFVVRLDPPSGCVPFGSRVKATVSFSDALGLPATSAPPVGTLSVSFDKQFVFERPLDVGPDPHTPGCLSFSFLSVGTGTCTMSIACRGGGTQTTRLCSTGGADTGAYDGLSLAVKPSILPPGGVFSLIATPVDGVGNTLRDFPVARGYVAELSSSDEPEDLRVQTGGHAIARMTCPLAPGKYTVSVGTHAVAVEVSSDVVVASRHVGNCTRSVLQRLPLMAQFTEVLEGAYRACRVEASEAQQQAMRMKTKEADLRGLHKEELAAVREAAELEKEALHCRVGEMKKKLAEERSEQDDLQQRWDEREAAIERERAVHVEDRRLWMEERNRLTQQDEENTSVIASLRQQVAELQAKLKQLQAASERRSAEQEDAFTQRITADRRRADADVASAEARCQAALEMAEEHKAAAEFEHQRVEQHLVRIEELDQVLLSMKTTMHEIGQQRLQLEDRVARMDIERTESLRQHERKVEEVTRKHHHTVTLLKQTHLEEVETLRREATDAHSRAERRVETLTADVESRRATYEAQASQERVRVAQEQEELRQHGEELQAKLRAAQRELQAETEARETQAQAWDAQRRALERRASEAAQAAREVEQRAAAEADSLQLAAEHDRQAWGREHASLLERATQQREAWDEQRALLEERLDAANAQHHAAAQQWEAARSEAAAAHARQREKLEEAARQAGAQLEEEKGANEDERRVWMTERTDLKARANHLQLQLDETQRKASRVTDEMYDELALEREEWTQRCSELERELHEARKAAADAAAKQKVEIAALKTSLEERRQEYAARVATLEAAAKQGEEELAAEKRRATRDAQMLNEDFEVEREKFRLKAVGTQQQLENQRAELEEAHERHAMKLAEVEAERLRYVAEQSQLREKLVQLEAEASALAEEHKAQLAEGDRLLAKARKEAEAALQAQAAQLEAQFLQRLEGDVQALEDARRVAEQEWKEELARQADALRAELARVQAASAEREGIQERFLDEARENFNEEISKLEAQLAKAKAEKLAVRQKAEEERAEERRRARAEQQEAAEEHARARTAWEEEQDRLLRAQDETRAAHQRELNEKNRQLQRAGLEEAEAQHEEARREMVALREAWQTQLAITSEAHDKDRAAFAREREEWRAERARLWSERNASKQQLEAALAATDDVRDSAENAAARRTDEVATLAERVAELEHQRDELARQGEERAAADHALLVAGRQEWVQEKAELHAALEEARVAEERLRAERAEAGRDLEEAGRRAEEAEAEAARRARKEGGELRAELEAARGSVASLQREVARASKEGDELRRRLSDGADRARQDMEALRGEHEEAAQRTRRESEAAAEALGLTKRTLAEAEAQLERAREEAQAERVRGREEYEELTASHAELQRRYAERMQSSATEARELRARGSEVDARWRDKEAELTKALAAAKELAGQERSAYERRLESVMASMEEQMAEKSSELRSLHLQLQDAQGDAEQVWQERVRVERSLKERLESEKRAEHEQQQASGQLANYKRLLSEVQDKRDADAAAAASERAEWKAERARARDEVDALKRQIQDLEGTLLAEMGGDANGDDSAAREAWATQREHAAEAHRREVENLTTRLRHLGEEKQAEVRETRRVAAEQVDRLAEEVSRLRRAAQSEDARETELELRVEQLTLQLQDAGEDAQRALQPYQQRLQRAEAEAEELRVALAAAQEEAAAASLSPLRSNGVSDRDSVLQKEIDRLAAKCKHADHELGKAREEIEQTKREWHTEKNEFDAFLQELESEKDRDKERAARAAEQAWHREREQLRAEIARLTALLSSRAHSAGAPERSRSAVSYAGRTSSSSSLSNPTPLTPYPVSPTMQAASLPPRSVSPAQSQPLSYGAYRSVSPQPVTLEEVRDALFAEYGSSHGSIPEVLANMSGPNGELTEDILREELEKLGMGQAVPALIAAALDEAQGRSLAEGLTIILSTPSQYEAMIQQYEENEVLVAEQNRRIMAQRRGATPIPAVQVMPAVHVQTVQTSTTTVRTSKSKASPFAYFGVEVTDGLRVGDRKQDYFGVKVVKSKGAALQAGVAIGDIVKEIAGRHVTSLAEFREIISTLSPKVDLTMVVERDDQELVLTLKPQATNATPGSLARYTQSRVKQTHLLTDHVRSTASSESSVTARGLGPKRHSAPNSAPPFR